VVTCHVHLHGTQGTVLPGSVSALNSGALSVAHVWVCVINLHLRRVHVRRVDSLVVDEMLSAVTTMPETGDTTSLTCAIVCCLHFNSPDLSGFLSTDVPSLLLILES
jgi:hypothetical protein